MSMTSSAARRPPAASGFGRWLPWTDRSGRAVLVKLAVFVAVCLPALMMMVALKKQTNPVAFIIHESGDWSMRLLVATLAVTPLRRITHWSRLILVRRMLGLAAFAYALIHLVFYMWGQEFDWALILSDGLTALYLTIGYIALFGLVVLAMTSNDASIRNLGAVGWNRLHLTVYAAVILSLVHFLLEVRADADEVTIIFGLLLVLFAYRFLRRTIWADQPAPLLAIAPVCGILTALCEAAYYRWGTGVDGGVMLRANLDMSDGIRPAWWVFGAGLALAVLSKLFAVRRQGTRRTVRSATAPLLGIFGRRKTPA